MIMGAWGFWFLAAACLIAACYQLASLAASIVHLLRRDPLPAGSPGVSILKPIHGLDDNFEGAIQSHAAQDYPAFEILFGVNDPGDASIPLIERLQRDYPNVSIRLFSVSTGAPNAKVGVLSELAGRARHPLWLVNDSDIRVPPGYLRRIAAPLEDAGVGLVTCIYRAAASSWPGRFEALGIATDFAPSTLVAPYAGVREFGLGSTLLFRASDLARIGGFAAISDYLADDYQLARRLTGLGLRVHLSKVVVESGLQAKSWRDVWHHQLRWCRTIRVSRLDGFLGLPVTFASFWALVAMAAGQWWIGSGLLALRYAAALVAGLGVLRCPVTARLWPLVAVRDLFGVAVWIAAWLGREVQWRDKRLRLLPGGRITQGVCDKFVGGNPADIARRSVAPRIPPSDR